MDLSLSFGMTFEAGEVQGRSTSLMHCQLAILQPRRALQQLQKRSPWGQSWNTCSKPRSPTSAQLCCLVARLAEHNLQHRKMQARDTPVMLKKVMICAWVNILLRTKSI